MDNYLKCSNTVAEFFRSEIGVDPQADGWFELDKDHPEYLNFIDESQDEPGMLSFHTRGSMAKHEIGELASYDQLYNPKHRIRSKPGKVFRRIYACSGRDISSNEIADIVRKWEQFINLTEVVYVFDVVQGEDIRKSYLVSNSYVTREGKRMGSCMSGEDEQEYLDLYVDNQQIALGILKVGDKVAARSLVWNDEWYDRIYGCDNFACDRLERYLQEKGLKNIRQASHEIAIKLDCVEYDYYPYIDTLYRLDMDKSMACNYYPYGHEVRTCRETNGSYEENSLYECAECGREGGEDDMFFINDAMYCSECCCYSDYYEEYIIRTEARWSECMNTYLHEDDATYCAHGDDYTHNDRAVRLFDGEYADNEDSELVELYNGDYALMDIHDLTWMDYKSDYALTEDVIELYDGEYALQEDCVELFDGSWALDGDDDVVECFDGIYMLECDTVETYNGLIASKDDCEQLRDGSWALNCDPIVEMDDIDEVKYA